MIRPKKKSSNISAKLEELEHQIFSNLTKDAFSESGHMNEERASVTGPAHPGHLHNLAKTKYKSHQYKPKVRFTY